MYNDIDIRELHENSDEIQNLEGTQCLTRIQGSRVLILRGRVSPPVYAID